MLREYTPDTSHVIEYGAIPLQEDSTYEEKSVKILMRELKVLRSTEKTWPVRSYSQRGIRSTLFDSRLEAIFKNFGTKFL